MKVRYHEKSNRDYTTTAEFCLEKLPRYSQFGEFNGILCMCGGRRRRFKIVAVVDAAAAVGET